MNVPNQLYMFVYKICSVYYCMPIRMDCNNTILCDYCGNQILVNNNNTNIICDSCSNDICFKLDTSPLTLLLFGSLPRVAEVDTVAAGRGDSGQDQGDGRNVTTTKRAHINPSSSYSIPRHISA